MWMELIRFTKLLDTLIHLSSQIKYNLSPEHTVTISMGRKMSSGCLMSCGVQNISCQCDTQMVFMQLHIRPLGPQQWEILILVSTYWAIVVPTLITTSYIMLQWSYILKTVDFLGLYEQTVGVWGKYNHY